MTSYASPADPYTPTESEMAEKLERRDAWAFARAEKQYELSDLMRAAVEADGFMPPCFESWHPVFESTLVRHARLMARQQQQEEKK